MHAVAGPVHDATLIPAVDLSAELAYDWRDPSGEARETLGQWLARFERDLSDIVIMRLAADPPPGDDPIARTVRARLQGWAWTLRGRAADRRRRAAAPRTARGRR
jgi:hypothetical protein